MIEYLIAHFSYKVLFFWSILEGEIGLALAGYMVKQNKFDFATVLLLTTSGAFIGDMILFLSGRIFRSKTEFLLKNYDKKIQKVEGWFRHFGSWIIIFERFIYGTHIPVLLILGVSGFNFWKFLLVEIIGVLLWSVTFTVLGYTFGQTVIDMLSFVQRHLTIVFIAIFFFYVIYLLKKEEEK